MIRRALDRARRHTAARALVIIAAYVAAGCADTTDTSNTIESTFLPMSIVVDPSDFVTDIACADRPGAMRSFVATITDSTEEAAPFALPSSPPTSCSQPVFFQYVAAEHVYTARVDAYDVPPAQIVPVGGLSSGNSHMLAVDTGLAVAPRWTTECLFAAVAQLDTTVAVGGCELFGEAESPTTVEVDPKLTLGSLACVPDGNVTSFDVHPNNAGLGAYNGSACNAAPLTYSAGIEDGVEYVFTVLAHESGAAQATLQATCFAVAHAGVSVAAVCDPLSPIPSSP